jgi:hypothetical protein
MPLELSAEDRGAGRLSTFSQHSPVLSSTGLMPMTSAGRSSPLAPVGIEFLIGDDDRIQLGDYILKMLTPSCGYVYAVCTTGAHLSMASKASTPSALCSWEQINR